MTKIAEKTVASRTASPSRPYPSWTEMLAQVNRGATPSANLETPPAREWRDLVADMIVGKR